MTILLNYWYISAIVIFLNFNCFISFWSSSPIISQDFDNSQGYYKIMLTTGVTSSHLQVNLLRNFTLLSYYPEKDHCGVSPQWLPGPGTGLGLRQLHRHHGM